MATLLVKGRAFTDITRKIDPELNLAGAYPAKQILLANDREIGALQHELDIEADDVFEVETTDNVTWVLTGEELLGKFASTANRTRAANNKSGDVFELNASIIFPSEERGIGNVINLRSIIKWAFKRAIKEIKIINGLVEIVDKKLVENPGLFRAERLLKNGLKEQIKSPTQLSTTEPNLIFIHGTAANVEMTYGKLTPEGDTDWLEVQQRFSKRIYAYQHHTISKSPLDNAVELIALFPATIKLHLVTSSRGGLIGELIFATAYYKQFPAMLDILKNQLAAANDRSDDVKNVEQLIQYGKTKKIDILDYNRIACPANGTILASGRLDKFFLIVLNALKLIPGIGGNPIYEAISTALLNLINAKADCSQMPGLEAMMPESPFIKALNSSNVEVDNTLKIIAGDTERSKIFRAMAVLLSDIYYRTEHDFIVNTNSMFCGYKRKHTQYIYHKSGAVSHFNYYYNNQTRNPLYAALKGVENSIEFSKLPDGLNFRSPSFSVTAYLENTRGYYKNKIVVTRDEQDMEFESEAVVHKLDVKLTHGDLGFAEYPLIVGHFEGDGIVSSEKAVDKHMDRRLVEMHLAGIYPGEVETSAVLLKEGIGFQGAVVVGLGSSGELSGESLAASVAHGAVNLAFRYANADKKINQIGISALLIGSGYAGISIKTSIRSIIDGISRANRRIKKINNVTVPFISKIQFIELYEDRAMMAAKFINNTIINETPENFVQSKVEIDQAPGFQKRLFDNSTSEWWYRLQILTINNEKSVNKQLRYVLLNNGAKVEEMLVYTQRILIDKIIDAAIHQQNIELGLSKLLFNLLVPNSIKDFTQEKRNLLLIVDAETAAYPWELMYNPVKEGNKPIAVNSGMIRQLIVESPHKPVLHVAGNTALVIGDPKVSEGWSQLEGARAEATAVQQVLEQGGYKVNALIDKDFMAVISALHNSPYKIMHFAGHGDVDLIDPKNSGMILDNNIRITPSEVAQLDYIPELVFVNCCFLGSTQQVKVQWNQLAANLGTQFINIGVKCVVAAGWAVNDAAAEEFAKTFYDMMVNGFEFGEAVQTARQKIFDDERFSNNTWGAYQCYGDPFYKLDPLSKSKSGNGNNYVTIQECIVGLNNLIQRSDPRSTRSKNTAVVEAIKNNVDSLDKTWLKDAQLLEAIADSYYAIGEWATALNYYNMLYQIATANFKLDSLYRFSKIAMKIGVEMAKSGKNKEEKAAGENWIILSYKIADNINNISENAYALLLVAGITKQHAYLFKGVKRINKLKASAELYEKAFRVRYAAGQGADYYPLHNWLTIFELLKCYKIKLKVNPQEVAQFIQDANSTKKSKKIKLDLFRYHSAEAEFEIFQVLSASKLADKKEKIAEGIVKHYKLGWDYGGTYYKTVAILEQINFILEMMKEAPVLQKDKIGVLEIVHQKLSGIFVED